MNRPTMEAGDDHAARVAALIRFIDWAEREARALNAADCGACLQLARVALRSAPLGGFPEGR